MQHKAPESIEACTVVANHDQYGPIVEVKTVELETVRIAEREFKSGRNLLKIFTRTGECKKRFIHRANLFIGEAQLTPWTLQQQEMKSAGFEIAQLPRSDLEEQRLLRQGFHPFLKDGA